MHRPYLALSVLLMLIYPAAQTHRPGGYTGRNPLCAGLIFPKLAVAPRQIEGETVYPVGNDVSAPVSVKETKPVVRPDKVNFKGTVIVCAIVARDGVIRTAGIDRAAGQGLDEIALETVKQWQFRPAMKGGHPVAAPVSLQIKFGN
jgi:TonB family protein